MDIREIVRARFDAITSDANRDGGVRNSKLMMRLMTDVEHLSARTACEVLGDYDAASWEDFNMKLLHEIEAHIIEWAVGIEEARAARQAA
jgi:hypothetical protein